VRRLLRAIVALLVGTRAVRGAARGEQPEQTEADPRRREIVSTPRRELVLAVLLLAAAAFAIAFVVLILGGDPVQWEAVTLGGAFACLAAALGYAGLKVVPQETEVEERPQLEGPEAEEQLRRTLAAGGDGVSRRRLLTVAGLTAGGSLAAALAVPAISLGPAVGEAPFRSPWRRGRALVDEHGEPISADDVVEGSHLTAFPADADPRELGSPVALVRVAPDTLRLPPERRDWAPEGLLAYSKICTHAGCAVSLYRYPLSEDTTGEPPALACPCHYSMFAVREGARVIGGPAGRPLPQLPLEIAADRTLRAAGPLSGAVGPAWWGVRRT